MNRIKDKIKEIEKYTDELKMIVPKSFDDYTSNFEKKAACERYFEKIIEALTDLAFLIIKEKRFRVPKDDQDAFNILYENKIIDKSLSENLADAKGMRNIIAHQYGKIDDELVYEAITKEINEDITLFLEKIETV